MGLIQLDCGLQAVRNSGVSLSPRLLHMNGCTEYNVYVYKGSHRKTRPGSQHHSEVMKGEHAVHSCFVRREEVLSSDVGSGQVR